MLSSHIQLIERNTGKRFGAAPDAGRTHFVNKGGITGFIETIFNYFALIKNLDVYI